MNKIKQTFIVIQKLGNLTRAIVYALIVLCVLGVMMPASWVIVEEGSRYTSTDAFCESCHTMKPFVAAHHDDLHGGNNTLGLKAECTSCHLPHDNAAHYLFVKTRTGLHDVWAELFYDTDAIDWKAKTERNEEFVYDSGCLSCHAELEETDYTDAHERYFNGETSARCVTCHAEVGHKNLNQYLLQNKYSK
ncbi:MAG: NapC/NirT family cytochrome c [Anaerolineae bacterium]|nr:NapC/NirT family cytochrome c [Anaerolineae bacterium]